MLFTILIPTYNRSHTAAKQIQRALDFAEQAHKLDGIKIEILVSDNCSKIPVKSIVEESDKCRIISPDSHLPTAEQNLFFALEHSRGDYTWILTDEDIPIYENVRAMFSQTQIKGPDLVVGTATYTFANGKHVPHPTICSHPEKIVNFKDFVQRVGLLSVPAGFSCLLLKTSVARSRIQDFFKYKDESKIYSHVFWLLEIFGDRKFLFFNLPIIHYIQNQHDFVNNSQSGEKGDSVSIHWLNSAKREKVFDKFFWTLGLIRQICLYCRTTGTPESFFAHVIEKFPDEREMLFNYIVFSTLEQIQIQSHWLKKTDNPMSLTEYQEIKNFICLHEPRLEVVFDELEHQKDFLNRKIPKRVFDTFYRLRPYPKFLHQTYAGIWDIYYFDNCYKAVPRYIKIDILFSLFYDISPESSSVLLVSPTLEEMKELIKQTPLPFVDDLQSDFATFDFRSDLTIHEVSLLKKAVRAYDRIKHILPRTFLRKISR